MNLFEHTLKNYSVYPRIMGYHYLRESAPELVDEINKYEFVFISSYHAVKIPGCTAIHMMTSADRTTDSVMWLQQDFSSFSQMPASEYTEVPVVGFVGRLPVFSPLSSPLIKLHKGFEDRHNAITKLAHSMEICTDMHIHTDPDGDSAGFWNETRPDYKKNGPLFKTNMLACQYQLCTRGNANWSLRFYETLAYGRIPIYVDSNGKFPLFDGCVCDFGEKCGGLPFPVIFNLDDIESEILEFHSNFRDDCDMQDCQGACREFYDEHFSKEAQIREFDFRFEEFWG